MIESSLHICHRLIIHLMLLLLLQKLLVDCPTLLIYELLGHKLLVLLEWLLLIIFLRLVLIVLQKLIELITSVWIHESLKLIRHLSLKSHQSLEVLILELRLRHLKWLNFWLQWCWWLLRHCLLLGVKLRRGWQIRWQNLRGLGGKVCKLSQIRRL